MSNEIKIEQITEILKNSPFDLAQEIEDTAPMRSYQGWNSLKHLMFLMEIEKRFEINISPEEIPKIVNLADLLAKLNQN